MQQCMSGTATIRLYCPQPFFSQATLELADNQVHYLQHVMRCREGDPVTVFNGQDGEWLGVIDTLKKKHGTLTLSEQRRQQTTEPDIWLAFAPVKNAAIHFLAQKATELGVSALHPVFTDRTVVSRVNTEKLSANTIEAAEQCERLTIPSVEEGQPLTTFLSQFPQGRTLIYCDESGKGQPITAALQQAAKTTSQWAILIGPEGGFSAQEREILHKHPNTLPVGLGPRILRADTAALAALACFQAICGDGHIAPKFLSN